jgi:integrase
MASIKKIENKKGIAYKISISMGYDLQGKKIVETTTYRPDTSLTLKQQEKAVEKFAMEFEDKIKNGKLFSGEKLSFEEFAEKWLGSVKQDLAYGTYENYEALLKNRIIPHFKGYKLAKIKLPMIEDFYRIMINEYAYSSVKKIDILMNNMFKTAIRWEMIETNPCSLAKLPKKKDKPIVIKFFTPQQALIFQKSLDMTYEVKYKGHFRVDDTGLPYFVDSYTENKRVPTQFKVFFNIALLCGMRRGEILALHWGDIDFEDKVIRISKSVTKTEHGIDFKEPKTYSSSRTITIPETLILLLKQYKKEYNLTRLQLGDYWKGNDNLFIQADGKLMGRSTSYHYFKRHIERFNDWVISHKEDDKMNNLEVLPDIPLHGLRHSCATLLNFLGVNIIDISNVLGHAQTSTTMNIYAHSFEEQKRVASEKIDEFLMKNA